ncbi:hypothetical protein JVU11DRAFT_9070 [Chiua virens]|nr:hypothetical protein JVU11DRAFT_9070 [Chiua virens]
MTRCILVYICVVSKELKAYGLADSALSSLSKFLGLELLGEPYNLEDNLPQGAIEEEEELLEGDRLAETELELEMEMLAAEDPDVVGLEEDFVSGAMMDSAVLPSMEERECEDSGSGDSGLPDVRMNLVAPSKWDRQTDDSCETTEMPSTKCTRTRQVLDCVLVPCSSTPASSKLPARSAAVMTSTQVTEDLSPNNHTKAEADSDTPNLAFVLAGKDHNVPKPHATMSASCNTDLYMRFTFGIDMASVPGRIQRSCLPSGKAAKRIERASVEHEVDSTPATNRLIRDVDLARINCAYLRDYDLIICQNIHNGTLCGYGVPLASLFLHCWGPDLPHQVEFCKRRDIPGKSTYTPDQKHFIQRILARYPNVVTSIPEMRALRMRSNQFGPIAHIGASIPGYKCSHCDFAVSASSSKEGSEPLSMREHWQEHRRVSPNKHTSLAQGVDLRHSDEFQGCLVQSFDRDKCHTLWLPVPPGLGAQGKSIEPQKSFGQLLSTGPRLPSVSTGFNRTAVLPFFLQNGAYDLIHPLDPIEIAKLIELPRKDERGLQKLLSAVLERFKGLCDSIPSIPSLIRRLLVAPRLEERGILERFNRPVRESTIRSYALEEVRLLCFVIHCIESGKYIIGASESPVSSSNGLQVGLTRDQFECFQALLWALSSKSHFMQRIHAYKLTIYLQGGFAPPKDVTVYYAKIQFGIRLTTMADIQNQNHNFQITNTSDEDCDDQLYLNFQEYVQEKTRRWVSEEHISPHAFVRGCMKAMSHLARRAPSGQTVMWNTDNTKLAVESHTVTISEYVNQVHSSLAALASKVDKEILFGVKFSEESFNLPSDTSEINDLETLGFSLFAFQSDSGADMDGHPSAYFLQQLCQLGHLCIRQEDEIIWEAKRLNEWLLSVSQVWSECLTLMHLLSLPGRGTEVTSWQHANSPTSPRHLFLSKSLGTLITHSSYNKTTALTGQFKYIIRVIPFALSTILTKLLHIVRPIEALAFTSQTIGDKTEIQNIYSTYLFVSHGKMWDSSRLSTSLHAWFLRELKVPFGLHMHRHFAQALQRKFLSYAERNELNNTANNVMGHGRELADLHYARETQDLNLDTSERCRMEQVGVDWIARVHKLEVSLSLTH